MIAATGGDQVQWYPYKTTDTSIPLTTMLDHITHTLSWALARGEASVGAFQKSPSDWVPITSLSVLVCYFYGYTLNSFSFSSETVNT